MNPTDQARVAKPTFADWSGSPAFLRDADRIRLRNLFERTIGRGFKMAVIETPTPREGDELLEWLRPHFTAAGAAEHVLHLPTLLGPPDEHRRLRTTVWEALTQTLPSADVVGRPAVLVLRDIEDLQYADQQNRFDLLQQFNVQRDLLVRDYPCFWLLLIHPRSRHHWYLVAPDFSDFVALWIEAPEPEPRYGKTGSVNTPAKAPLTGSHRLAPDNWPEPLQRASNDISLSKYDEALDQLHTFLTETPDTPDAERDRAIARMLETGVWVVRGQIQRAFDRLKFELLPVFEQLGVDYERAATMGRIADILEIRGELDEALRIRREEQLPVYERLGDVRSRAVTQGKIADILQARGELDEALRIRREEQLPVFERLGDVRSRAITQVKLAMGLIQRKQPEDIELVGDLLSESLADLERLKLPEVELVRRLLSQWQSRGESR